MNTFTTCGHLTSGNSGIQGDTPGDFAAPEDKNFPMPSDLDLEKSSYKIGTGNP